MVSNAFAKGRRNQMLRIAIINVLERDGCQLHFWLAGPADRPLVVLIHGMALNHHMFDPQVAALVGEYRVLTWDLRGHGQSQPPGMPFSIAQATDDLLAILDHLGQQQAIFVGHSLGGIIAQELAFRVPGRVVGLVSFGCSCSTLPVGWPLTFAQRLVPLPLRLMTFVPYWPLLRLGITQMAVQPAVRIHAADMASHVIKTVFLQVIAALATSRHGQIGYRITQPLLLVYGEHDRFGSPQRIARAWAARDQQAQIVAIPNAGHNANQDHPHAFNTLLLGFLREL
jgi:pimeloyl-ACP methyl ester carboxylesterase